MTIREARLLPYHLSLKQTWQDSHGRFDVRQGWLIQLRNQRGMLGYGDCAPMPQAGTEDHNQALVWLEPRIINLDDQPAERVLAELDNEGLCPAARCGLETALLDLLAKDADVSVAKYLNPHALDRIKVNTNGGALSEAEPLYERRFPIIKLKVGLQTVEQDIARLRRFVEASPPGIRIRLDANGAWSEQEAMRFIQNCEGMPVESIEEPLRVPNLQTLKTLQTQTAIILALDESLPITDKKALFESQAVRRVVLKPMREGGLKPALSLAEQACAANMDCVVTTTVDSAVGVWAATQLAAALGKKAEDLAHGLATSDWLVEDVGNAPPIENGCINIRNIKGLGFTVK